MSSNRRVNRHGISSRDCFKRAKFLGGSLFRHGWQLVTALLSVALLTAFPATSSAKETIIYVRVLVDDDEVARQSVWQDRLQKRVEAASEIISRYSSIRFKVRAFGTWNSDNRIRDMNRSLREFEQEVSPKPGQIAIGFSSQYQFRRGRNTLGGTRGPLHSHILLRESSPKTFEPEKLEALVHELGHFLGAAHSAHRDSVMRPVIGDGQARAKNFQIGFDDVNAKIMRMVSNEVTHLRVRRYRDLSDRTKQRLLTEYVRLAKELPADPAARKFVELIVESKTQKSKSQTPKTQNSKSKQTQKQKSPKLYFPSTKKR